MRSLRRRLTLGPRMELALAVAFVTEAVVEQFARSETEHSLRALAVDPGHRRPIFVRRTHPVAGTIVAAALIAAAPETTGSFPPSLYSFVLPVVLAYSCGAYAATGPGLVATAALTVALQIHMGLANAPPTSSSRSRHCRSRWEAAKSASGENSYGSSPTERANSRPKKKRSCASQSSTSANGSRAIFTTLSPTTSR